MFSTFSSLSSMLTKTVKAVVTALGLGTGWANISSSLNVTNTAGCSSIDRSYIFGMFFKSK